MKQTNELYQLAAVAFCLLSAWVSKYVDLPFMSRLITFIVDPSLFKAVHVIFPTALISL